MLTRKSISKLMAVILSIAIILSMAPVSAFAEMDNENPHEDVQIQDSDTGTEPATPGATDAQTGEGESNENPQEENQSQEPDPDVGPATPGTTNPTTPGMTDAQTGEGEDDEIPPEEPEVITPEASVGIMPLTTGAGLATQISSWSHGGTGTLSASESSNTVTVTGTVTGAANTLTLNIDENVTVVWKADLGFAESGLTTSRLTLSGKGTFQLPSGGKISGAQVNASAYIINVTESVTFEISGGEVVSTASESNTYYAIAIGGSSKFNMTAGSITSGNAGIRVTSDNPDMVIISGGTIETVNITIGAKTSKGNIKSSDVTLYRKTSSYNAPVIEPGIGFTYIKGIVKTDDNNGASVIANPDAGGLAINWTGTGTSFSAGNTTNLGVKPSTGGARADWGNRSGTGPVINYTGGTSSSHTGYIPVNGVSVNRRDNTAPTIAGGNITKKYGDAKFTVSATGGNGTGTFSFSSSNQSVATIASTSGEVTIVGAGTTNIKVKKLGDDYNYDSADSAAVTLTVNKGDQTKPVISGGSITKKYGDTKFTVTATGGNGTGAYSFSSSNTAAATIDSTSGEVTIIGVGTTNITVKKLGDNNYNESAVSTAVTLTVNKADQTTPVIGGGDITKKYGDANFNISATGGSGTGAYIYTSSNTAVATVNASGLVTLGTGAGAIGTTKITVKKLGDANYNDSAVSAAITLTVEKNNQTTPVISGGNITKKYGDANFSLSTTGGNGTGAFSYTSSNTAVATVNAAGLVTLGTGAGAIGTTSITVKKLGDANYNDSAVSSAVTLTVNKADQAKPAIAYTREGDPSTTGVIVTITSPSPSVAEFSKNNFSSTETSNVISFPKDTESATIYARMKATETHNMSPADSVFINFSKLDKEAPPSFTMTGSYNSASNKFTVTIPEVAGAEYSFDGSSFSQTRTATVNPGSKVEGYMRYLATDTHNASPSVSSSLTLTVPVTGITVTGADGKTAIEFRAGTLQMSAGVMPTDATNKSVKWSVLNDSGSASISGSGLLTAISDGSVTVKATANDGFGAYGILEITIGNPNAPTKLVLSKTGDATNAPTKTKTVTKGTDLDEGNNISSILTATVYSIKGDVITPDVIWTSNNKDVINIDSNGTITGLKAGTATISARVAGYPAAYDYCHVKVNENMTTAQVLKIKTEYKPNYIVPDSVKNNAYNIAGRLTDTKSESDPTKDAPITLKAFKEVEGAEAPAAVTWKTSDAKVAAVKVVNGEAQITYKETGTAVITAETATGTPKDVVTVTIRVGDISPKVPVTSLTVYNNPTSTGAAFKVLPSDNFEFSSLSVVSAVKGKASVENPGTKFLLAGSGNNWMLKAPEVEAGIYKVTLNAPNISPSNAGNTDARMGNFDLTVEVLSALPNATLKAATLNTFWNDADGLITITGSKLPEIKEINIKNDPANADFKSNFSIVKRGSRFYAVAKTQGDLKTDSNNKPVVKGDIVVVYDGGMTQTINLTIPVKSEAPKLALALSAITINKTRNPAEATFTISGLGNKIIGEVNPNSAADNGIIIGAIRNTGSTFTVTLKGSEAKPLNNLQLNVMLVGARSPILLKPTVKTVTNDGSFKLSSASLTFSKKNLVEKGQEEIVKLMPVTANAEAGTVTVTEVKTAPEGVVTWDSNSKALKVNVTKATAPGTHKYTITAEAAGGAGFAGVQTLTVKVEDKPLTAAIKVEKGSTINLMDRTGTQMTYVPTIKNSTSPIDADKSVIFEPATGTTLKDSSDTSKLIIEAVDGNIVVKANPAANIKKGEQFKGKLMFTLADGNPAETGVITIKVAQTAVKHNIPKSITMYQSCTDANHHVVIDLNPVTPTGAKIKEDSFGFKTETAKNMSAGKFVNNPNNAYWFSFDEESQELHIWIKDSSLVKIGKSTLVFSATYEGQGWESFKPINSTATVEGLKPVDIKIPVTMLR